MAKEAPSDSAAHLKSALYGPFYILNDGHGHEDCMAVLEFMHLFALDATEIHLNSIISRCVHRHLAIQCITGL